MTIPFGRDTQIPEVSIRGESNHSLKADAANQPHICLTYARDRETSRFTSIVAMKRITKTCFWAG